jgi:AraC-like DNA-binding protein
MEAYLVKKLVHFCNISVKKSHEMPDTTINFYDLTFVIKGRLLYYINGEKCEIGKNDAILLPPGTLRSRVGLDEEVSYVSFNFQLNEGVLLPDKLFLSSVITEDIRTLLSAFSQTHISPLYHSEQKAQNLLNYILFEILDVLYYESNDKNVSTIIKFIDEHMGEKITLSMISDHVHLSREYVAYIFKRETGKTIVEYINERKMLLAKDMIQNGNITLGEVAERLGFENYGYFSRCFKKHFNTSPKSFQK